MTLLKVSMANLSNIWKHGLLGSQHQIETTKNRRFKVSGMT